MSISARPFPGLWLCLCLIAAAAAPSHAQAPAAGEAEQGVERRGTTVIYHADFFTRFQPVSAKDMVDRIPGLSLTIDTSAQQSQSQQQQRGLGAGENQILINGKRVAGKANEGIDALVRIPATAVSSIEIIRETSGELDVRSTGEIVNVVLQEGVSLATGSWRAALTFFEGDDEVRGSGSVSYGGDIDAFTYLASLEIETIRDPRRRFEFAVDPFGDPIDEIRELETTRSNVVTLNGNLSYQINNNDRIAVNGLFVTDDEPSDEFRRTFVPDGMGGFALSVIDIEDLQSDRFNWEFGADYAARFGPGRYKALFIANKDSTDLERTKSAILDGGMEEITDIEITDEVLNEKILRTSYTFPLFTVHSVEIGFEGALTELDSALTLFQPEDGVLVEQRIFNGASVIDEKRALGFIVDNWKIGEKATLRVSVDFDYSRIEQTGPDVEMLRDFFFVKPGFNFRYDITPTLQVRMTAQRQIQQLRFSDFTAEFNVFDDDAEVRAGNPDLVQEKSWDLDLTTEYRLPKDGGVVTATVFYNFLQDVVDEVPFGVNDDATGNIGSGEVYGISLDASIRLAPINLPDAFVTGSFTRRFMEVTDPFTGEERRLRGRPKWEYTLGYRHDVAPLQLSYGANFSNRGARRANEFDQALLFLEEPVLDVFIEKTIFGNVTIRLDGQNLVDQSRTRIRTRFLDGIANGNVTEIEDSSSTVGQRFVLSMRGTF